MKHEDSVSSEIEKVLSNPDFVDTRKPYPPSGQSGKGALMYLTGVIPDEWVRRKLIVRAVKIYDDSDSVTRVIIEASLLDKTLESFAKSRIED